ncbi:PAS domain-containing protein [Pseudooceanicola sp.]|uniref:PAS domain-containing protein n=1 Tax=Pseudooceanicola sp. TaxID=1914328 RepID=UPI0026117C58|nr:PAS domain-containing protein [Pseudooceanicola sp.]MDF1857280.1 PAS domain-containing protein [Pseudooceanicola sp.]
MDQHGKIIDMSPFIKDNRFPALREVEGYWQALRAGRLVPRRSEVDPRGIARALDDAFIVEKIAPGLARLRIAGSHLTELMGMEVRGMPLSAFFSPRARASASDLIEQMFDNPSSVELMLSAERGIGKPAIDARMILLPMKSDLGDISRALGCLSTRGAIGRTPRRFDITDQILRRLVPAGAGAETMPDAPPDSGPEVAADTPPLPGFAAPRPPAFDPGPGRPDAPFLRLVKSDD